MTSLAFLALDIPASSRLTRDWPTGSPSGRASQRPRARAGGVAGGFAPAGLSRRGLLGPAHQFGCWLPGGLGCGGSGLGALLGVVEALDENRAENPPAVTGRVQVADAVDPRMLVARDLRDRQPGLGDADVDQGLDLESVAPQPGAVGRGGRIGVKAEHRDVAAPEDVVPVAQVRVPGAAQQVDQAAEPPVTGAAQAGDVAAAAAGGEPAALGVVRAAQ